MMQEIELNVNSTDVTLPGLLSLPPDRPARGGVVPLHPSSDPSRDQFLIRHLADLLPRHGIAVLRYDRRTVSGDHDVPLDLQARDALAAVHTLREHPSVAGAPVGIWGFSQGAWAAPLAASLSPEVAFLALIASTGVSPAVQMRYGTAEQLRRAGYGDDALAELARLRQAYEEYLRGHADRTETQALVDEMAERPWFSLAYVARELPPPGAWEDMDFDPAPIFARVHCPVLLFYGEDDEWTPADASIEAWQRATSAAGNSDVTVVRLPGASHHPTLLGGREIDAISPLYTERLVSWLADHLSSRSPVPAAPATGQPASRWRWPARRRRQ
jgi:pimeloyl-ACP methyl ester carboxylesterase